MSTINGLSKTERISTSNTISTTYKPYQVQSPRSPDSISVANCIRGLNQTIEKLSKENTDLRSSLNTSTKESHSDQLNFLISSNESLKKKVKELKESNSELHERYSRVKELYDILSEKKSKLETFEVLQNSESEVIKEENKKLKEQNSNYLLEIQRLNLKLSCLQEKVIKLENNKKYVIEENNRSEKYVNDLAGINEELLLLIKQKSGCRKHHGHMTTPCSKKISRLQSKRHSFREHSKKKNH